MQNFRRNQTPGGRKSLPAFRPTDSLRRSHGANGCTSTPGTSPPDKLQTNRDGPGRFSELHCPCHLPLPLSLTSHITGYRRMCFQLPSPVKRLPFWAPRTFRAFRAASNPRWQTSAIRACEWMSDLRMRNRKC